MAAVFIGKVKSGAGRFYDVRWNSSNGDVYVSWCGGTKVPGRANSASQAANMAEVFLRGK